MTIKHAGLSDWENVTICRSLTALHSPGEMIVVIAGLKKAYVGPDCQGGPIKDHWFYSTP